MFRIGMRENFSKCFCQKNSPPNRPFVWGEKNKFHIIHPHEVSPSFFDGVKFLQIQLRCHLKNSGWNGSLFTGTRFYTWRPFFESDDPDPPNPILPIVEGGKNSGDFFFSVSPFFKMARHATLCEIVKHWYSPASCVDGWSISLPASCRPNKNTFFFWKFMETCLLLRWFHLAYLVSDFLRNSMQFQKSYGPKSFYRRGMDLLSEVRGQLRFDSFQHFHTCDHLVSRE